MSSSSRSAFRSGPKSSSSRRDSSPKRRGCSSTAMEGAQVKRLICVTGFGAGNSRGHGGFLYCAVFHLLLGRVYDDKDVQERIVRRSKLDWVIVRPVILTDGWAKD